MLGRLAALAAVLQQFGCLSGGRAATEPTGPRSCLQLLRWGDSGSQEHGTPPGIQVTAKARPKLALSILKLHWTFCSPMTKRKLKEVISIEKSVQRDNQKHLQEMNS